jgi:hypothetical protein
MPSSIFSKGEPKIIFGFMNCDHVNIFSSLLQSMQPEINPFGKLEITLKGNNSLKEKPPNLSECNLEQWNVKHVILLVCEHA